MKFISCFIFLYPIFSIVRSLVTRSRAAALQSSGFLHVPKKVIVRRTHFDAVLIARRQTKTIARCRTIGQPTVSFAVPLKSILKRKSMNPAHLMSAVGTSVNHNAITSAPNASASTSTPNVSASTSAPKASAGTLSSSIVVRRTYSPAPLQRAKQHAFQSKMMVQAKD